MEIALAVLAALILLFILFRSYWVYSSRDRVFTVDFDGTLYQVGQTGIAVREGDPDTDRTIICFEVKLSAARGSNVKGRAA